MIQNKISTATLVSEVIAKFAKMKLILEFNAQMNLKKSWMIRIWWNLKSNNVRIKSVEFGYRKRKDAIIWSVRNLKVVGIIFAGFAWLSLGIPKIAMTILIKNIPENYSIMINSNDFFYINFLIYIAIIFVLCDKNFLSSYLYYIALYIHFRLIILLIIGILLKRTINLKKKFQKLLFYQADIGCIKPKKK